MKQRITLQQAGRVAHRLRINFVKAGYDLVLLQSGWWQSPLGSPYLADAYAWWRQWFSRCPPLGWPSLPKTADIWKPHNIDGGDLHSPRLFSVEAGEFPVTKLGVVPPIAPMPNILVALLRLINAQYHAITKHIRAAIFSWLSVMRVPRTPLTFILVPPNKSLATTSAQSLLPIPCLLNNEAWK